jgi:phosphoserine phosphatase
MENEKKYVIVDICGTLYHSNTTFDFLGFYLQLRSYRRFRKLSRSIAVRLVNKTLLHLFRFDMIRWCAVRFLKGKTQEELLEAAHRFYDAVLRFKINHAALEKVSSFALERRPVLVSATLDFIARVIAEKLYIPDVFSTELEYDAGGACRGRIKNDLLGSKAHFLAQKNLSDAYDAVITDNYSDRSLFRRDTLNCVVASSQNEKKKWRAFAAKRCLVITFITTQQP